MRLIDATRLVKLTLIERDKIPLTVPLRYAFGATAPNRHGQSMRGGIRKILRLIEQAPTIDAVPVVHYKDTNTTVLNVKSIEDWQDRIILDEGEESRSSAMYYADSDDMVRVVRCKDCERRSGDFCPMRREEYCGYGFELSDLTKDDGYCSYGTAKDKKEATK